MGGYNFYYYRVSAKDSNKRTVDLEALLSGYDVTDQDITIERVISYNLDIKKEDSEQEDFWHGSIQRLKSNKEFYNRSSNGEVKNLAEKLDDERGETGEIKRDIVNFAYTIRNRSIYVLMEQGFQYPGMGVFIEFFEKLLGGNGLKFEHTHIPKNKTSNELRRIFSKKLKKVRLHFKRGAELSGPAERFIHNIALTEDYAVNFEISIKRLKKGTFVKVEDMLEKLFGVQNMENLLTIPYAELLSVFDLEYFEESPDHYDGESILRCFESERIDANKNNLQDFDSLSKKVCSLLIEKIEVISDDG